MLAKMLGEQLWAGFFVTLSPKMSTSLDCKTSTVPNSDRVLIYWVCFLLLCLSNSEISAIMSYGSWVPNENPIFFSLVSFFLCSLTKTIDPLPETYWFFILRTWPVFYVLVLQVQQLHPSSEDSYLGQKIWAMATLGCGFSMRTIEWNVSTWASWLRLQLWSVPTWELHIFFSYSSDTFLPIYAGYRSFFKNPILILDEGFG